MPRALEPNQRFSVVLDSDADKPAAVQPTFWFVSKSVRDFKATRERVLADDAANAWDATLSLLKTCLVDWTNMIDPTTGEAIPFNADELDRLVDFGEANELWGKVQFGARDKKKLG